MKLSCRYFAYLTLLATSSLAAAVELREGQYGDVLLFPFYTVENNWDTYLNVAGAGSRGRVLVLRFRAGEDGREVRTLSVYSRRAEAFRASLSRDAAGNAQMTIAEGECVIDEQLMPGGVGSSYAIEARTGLIEVYNVGQTYVDCAEALENWQPGGVWQTDPYEDIRNFGTEYEVGGELILVNVAEGLSASYPATVLGNFAEQMPHTLPGSASPNLADADPLLHYPESDPVSVPTAKGIDAVAQVIARNLVRLGNDVIVSPEIGARTDWVVTYPLQGYKNYKYFAIETGETTEYCENFGGGSLDGDEPVIVDALDGPYPLEAWSAGRSNLYAEFTPRLTLALAAGMCRAVNVVSFAGQAPILVPESSALRTAPGLELEDVESYQLRWFPLAQSPYYPPILGFRLTTFQNGRLDGGTLANYAILQAHRREVAIE